jgi:hypothetical protein
MKSVGAEEWRDGDGGKVNWQFDCDFPGYDIKNEQTPGEQCGAAFASTPTGASATLVTFKESVT